MIKMNQPYKVIYTVIIVFLIAMMGCATSPRKQERADAYLNVGIAYLGAERYNEALKELLEAEKLNSRDPKIHHYIGISYYGKELNDRAIGEFKKAIALKPDYSEAHNFLGTVYLEMGFWDNALESFKNALSNILYETPDKALFNMGRAYHGKGDYEKALSTYQDAKNKKPNTVPPPLIDHYMGITYFAQGNLEKAVQYLKTSLKEAPFLVESHYWLGQCYIKLNEREKAKAEFQAVIKITPESKLGIAARKSLDSIGSL
ncbi:MAG: hypothetical protein CO171_00430, partial [Syntrophobacterales bacterium CG_4_9_14_3_um_filter_49_8]